MQDIVARFCMVFNDHYAHFCKTTTSVLHIFAKPKPKRANDRQTIQSVATLVPLVDMSTGSAIALRKHLLKSQP